MMPRPIELNSDTPTWVRAVLVRVPAGFPSPAQDHFDDGRINLNEVLIKDVTSTFILRVSGDSMEGAGICDGDEVLVDRALTPRDGDVVVAIMDDEFTIKRLRLREGTVVLHPENPAYPDIEVPALATLSIWGVVSFCIHHLR